LTSTNQTEPVLKIQKLSELFALFSSSEAVTLQYAEGDSSLYLSRCRAEQPGASRLVGPSSKGPVNQLGVTPTPPVAEPESEGRDNKSTLFHAPMVGTFYHASSPDA